jgi:hypothetical protein
MARNNLHIKRIPENFEKKGIVSMTPQTPKYQQISTWFNIKARVSRDRKKIYLFHPKSRNKGVILTVRPFNSETTTKYPQDVSWSHGITHFEVKEWNRALYCGTRTFEERAEPVPPRPPVM